MKYTLLLFTFLCFTACVLSTWDTRLKLVNQTNKGIRYIDELKDNSDYIPDTTYCQTTDPYDLLPNSEGILRVQTKWEYLLRDHPERYLRVYIINEDSLSNCWKGKIFEELKKTRRRAYTIQEIAKLRSCKNRRNRKKDEIRTENKCITIREDIGVEWGEGGSHQEFRRGSGGR